MDEDNKKKNKRNNKKNKNKNKPQPTLAPPAAGEPTITHHHNHLPDETPHDHNAQVSNTIIDVGGNSTPGKDSHIIANGTHGASLPVAENQLRLDTQASFKETITQLQTEKDAWIHKEAILEEKIKQLLKEKDESIQTEASQKEKMKEIHDEMNASMQREAALKEKFIQLEKEKDALIHHQDSLEQKIKQLESEKDAHLQKEGSLEVKILQLEGEKNLWVQKEAGIREKINQLVDENSALNTRVVGVQEKMEEIEKERDSWIQTESSAKELIASLNNDTANLRAQVISLEQSRETLLEEKLQLSENISRLQLQINNLETAAGSPRSSTKNKLTSEDGYANPEIEVAPDLVEKLISENSELLEKVNALYAELDRRAARTEYVSSGPGAVTAQSTDRSVGTHDIEVGAADRDGFSEAIDSISQARNMMPATGSSRSLEDVMFEDKRNSRPANSSSEIIEVDEIVQIPLNESEVEETKLDEAENDDTTDVGLTDAPLIGAPFRLISFFARYVSGADLVENNTGR